jgi:predicted Co/Zn/Cd cation transporter (cation efflux family)
VVDGGMEGGDGEREVFGRKMILGGKMIERGRGGVVFYFSTLVFSIYIYFFFKKKNKKKKEGLTWTMPRQMERDT